jgi:hypothetical protein
VAGSRPFDMTLRRSAEIAGWVSQGSLCAHKFCRWKMKKKWNDSMLRIIEERLDHDVFGSVVGGPACHRMRDPHDGCTHASGSRDGTAWISRRFNGCPDADESAPKSVPAVALMDDGVSNKLIPACLR